MLFLIYLELQTYFIIQSNTKQNPKAVAKQLSGFAFLIFLDITENHLIFTSIKGIYTKRTVLCQNNNQNTTRKERRKVMEYLPYSERMPDYQYQNLLREILEKGIRDEKTQLVNKKGERVGAITLMGAPPMRFKLKNGFPMITERDVSSFWKQPIGEIFGFANGARTQTELEKFGCRWWKPWVTEQKCSKRGLETGDLGPGSYGAAFHDFPTISGGTFNQFKHLVEQIKEFPHLRTHIITPFIPHYIVRGEGKQQKVVVVPCHGFIHVRIIDNKLTLLMFQRSGDVPIGVPSNMIQYAALTLALAQVTRYEPYEYVHVISDAHIYLDQVPYVEKIVARVPRPFPTVKMKHSVINDIFSFRTANFGLLDYNPHPSIPDIPVAI